MSRPVIEEILPSLYRVEVPLPNNPLKATNSYVIKNNRNLIIDTGMNRKECKDALSSALEALKIDLNRTDYFITHMHADHFGLVGELAGASTRIFFSLPDAEIIKNTQIWQDLYWVAIKHGFSADELKSALEMHPGNRYSPKDFVEMTIVQDGDHIAAGIYNLRCVATPGHTRGHLCLYEPKWKLFFAGDHILGDITPNISSWDDLGNPLFDYLLSLDKVAAMNINLVLPGHRSLIRDCNLRIGELKEHHRQRLEEVLSILKAIGQGTAYHIASLMQWDIVAENWAGFPVVQKWFAAGEAIAHLKYLEEDGRVMTKAADDLIYYALA